MFECEINKYIFWIGFFIGGAVCIAIYELIQFIILSATGVRGLTKELKHKNDEEKERKEPKL